MAVGGSISTFLMACYNGDYDFVSQCRVTNNECGSSRRFVYYRRRARCAGCGTCSVRKRITILHSCRRCLQFPSLFFQDTRRPKRLVSLQTLCAQVCAASAPKQMRTGLCPSLAARSSPAVQSWSRGSSSPSRTRRLCRAARPC